MPESRNGRIIYSPEEQFTNSVERLKEIQTKYRKGRAILAEALAIKGGEQHSQEETAEMIRRVRQQTETENANIASAHDYAVKQYQRKHGIPPVTIDQPGYLDDYQEALLGHSNGYY